MYAVSFRIPYSILGLEAYVNGSAYCHTSLKPKTKISVTSGVGKFKAEVIQSIPTGRKEDSFQWKIVSVEKKT